MQLIQQLIDDHELVATYRNQNISLNLPDIESLHLDISDEASINNFLIRINNHEFSEVICLIGSLNGNNSAPSFLKLNEYISTYVTTLIYLIDSMFAENRIKCNSRIIIMSSRAAKFGSHDYLYAVVKGAMESYVKAKAKYKSDIRIISISTGLVLGSKMQSEMPMNIVANHVKRAGGNLLTVSSLCIELVGLINRNESTTGSTIYIGPQYE